MLSGTVFQDRRTTGVERLRGGSKKGVYRVALDGPGPSSVIVYRWTAEENYWPDAGDVDDTDPLGPASGPELFLAAWRRLDRLGVRVPRVLDTDGAEWAVVEDVTGGTLEALLARDPGRGAAAVAELGRALDAMHADHAPRCGRVDRLDRTPDIACEQRVYDRALDDLAEAARRDDRIAAARDRFAHRLAELRDRVAPRSQVGLIHGELGPDHVLLDADDRPVLIDIEGLMHFDVEWEHVFLRLRFRDHYPPLARPGLDPDRLALYSLSLHLNLVAGPLRLLDGDFPDRAAMLFIAERNLEAALALLP
ncbi:phosphotransferase [Saccharothrix violaceirubra]|uniref:tRNA A-37 threonylcarbamoyl transferase component Bud32 n=1 Tax=Saccharothrix violaceirubra TaxID=413306 RepID=A0A7W7T655_9PSEU|nr:phosphotransferase [Saccharothrix violaceirubra]MBB4965955.1 tRNA A-37 threonylcarbamoyl transferase component Bud32 [Saccharothrix violaceirubra]